jgi:general secretion pathway protein D
VRFRVFIAASVWILAMTVAAVAFAAPPASSPTAEQLFRQAQKAERDGQIVKAYLLYAEAAAADPTNIEYWSRAQALRPAASLVEASPPKLPDLPSDKIDRTLFGKITDQELEEARRPLPPTKLEIVSGPRDYDLQGDSRGLWEQVAAALKLKVLFDADYKPTRTIHFELADSDYRDTLTALQAATDSFFVIVSPRLIFVSNDTTQKRTQFERTEAIVIPFPETLTVQEIQEVATGIRGALDAKKLTVDTTRRLILIRDTITKVRLAQKLMADLLHPRPQVTIDVEILSTDLSSSLSYGLSLPTSFALSSFLNRANVTNAYNYFASSYSTFFAFGGGASMLGLGVTSAELFATVSKSSTQSIYEAQVAAVDGLPAQLHVGEKYPIMTSGYFGNTGTTGTVYTPPPTVNFEDLGLLIKVTPHVVSADRVTLELDAEFKLLGATSNDGIPVIANTQYQSKVDVGAGEWAVLSGLMTSQEAKAITGIPLLSYLPFLRNNTITKDQGATLIVLKPHVDIAPGLEPSSWRAWAGTETRTPPEL